MGILDRLLDHDDRSPDAVEHHEADEAWADELHALAELPPAPELVDRPPAKPRRRRRDADPLVIELAIIRQGRGLTIRDVARRAGLAEGTICRWERGARDPSLAGLQAYAGALGVDLAVVRPTQDTTRPDQMSNDELADALQRLAAEAAARLDSTRDGGR